MKKYLIIGLTLIFVCCIGISRVSAVMIDLFDWAFYVDGTTYEYFAGDTMPTTGTLIDGLGTLTWSTSTAGSHNFIAFFDHEIDEPINTFFNEFGMESGAAAPGQSWEIDEPGYAFGDIYYNVLAGALDNSNGVPPGWEDDVSMALGWYFSLNSGETGTITLELSDVVPSGSSYLYLSHTDPDSGNYTIYYSSTLTIKGGPVSVPEPGTMILFGSLILGILGIAKKNIKI